jgi:hypothetical protein
LEAGPVNATVTWALPAVALMLVGAPGAVAGAEGVTLSEGAEAAPVPARLVALTVHVTATPLVSGVTISGEVVPLTLTLPHVAS